MKTLFLPLLLLAHSTIPAQEWALSLSSNVELRTWKLSTRADKEEKGLAGASIKLYKGGGLVNEVSSGGNGDFRINIPANGEYLLEVSYPGCNSKKFAINTKDVPENVAKDNFKPSYRIDGFIMAKALPGIDYSYLSQPLIKVVYTSRGQKFLDDDNTTEKSIKAVTKISDAENKLIEKFCSTNREGDEALNKPDCPLAKSLYEKALTLIPGEAYPTQQLAKVGKCLQDKEAADKKALEASAAKTEPPQTGKTEPPQTGKKDADKKAVEDAVAKAKADKAAKDQAMNDQLAKAKAEESKKKEKEKGEKLASDKQEPAKPAATSASQPTTTVKTKQGTIKVKEKSEEQLEAERKRAGLAKSQAEDAAAIKADAEKAEQKRRDREQKEKEEMAKEKEEQQKKMEERRAKEKEAAEKEAAEQKEKAEKARQKQAEQEARDKEEAQKEAAERAEQEKADREEREKREAERAAKEKEERKKTYEKIEEKYANGKANADYSIPPVLGSTDMYKEKIKKGDEHFNNKRYKEAKTEYEAALKVKPADEYATNKLNEVNKLITP